jgi:hypothetical protein
VGPEGQIFDPTGIMVPTMGEAGGLALAWNGTHHLLASTEGPSTALQSVQAIRLSRTGAGASDPPMQVAGPGLLSSALDVAALAGTFVIAWVEAGRPAPSSVRLARLRPDGALLEPRGVTAVDFDSGFKLGSPAIVPLGAAGMVVADGYWSREANIRLRGRVFDQGSVLTAPPWRSAPDASEGASSDDGGPGADGSMTADGAGEVARRSSGCDCDLGPGDEGSGLGAVLSISSLVLFSRLSRTPGRRVS